LGAGSVQTQAGTGVRPGAWVSIATPFGVVSYANSTAVLTVGESLRVQPRAGGLRWQMPPQAVERLQPGQDYRFSEALALGELTRRCSVARKQAADQEAEVLAHRGPGLGELARTHVIALKAARASCLWAQAAALRRYDGEALSAALLETAPPP